MILANPVTFGLFKTSPDTAYFSKTDYFSPRYLLDNSITNAALIGPHIDIL